LFNLTGFWAIAVKIIAGLALTVLSGKFSNAKSYLKFSAIFFALSFALGGALMAVFSLAGIEYEQGGGYLISSIPVGIPLFCALLMTLFIKKIAHKLKARVDKKCVKMTIFVGKKHQSINGFFDSGNNVYYLGQPVSVVPNRVASKLINVSCIKNFTNVHTVSGSSKMPIFTADKIEISDGERNETFYKIKLGISPNEISQGVIHPDLAIKS
jgi:hypothetical protein